MNEKIPAWVLRTALIISLPIAIAALYLTRTYAVGNLIVLGLDAETVFVRRLSIDVLLSAHVAAFFLVALLPDSVFKFRRWQLYALALAIWAFDGAAIYQARFGGMDNVETVMATAASRFKTKQKTINDLQESAAERRAQASREWANKRFTDAKNGRDLASRESEEAAKLMKELDAMPSGAGTTEVKTWGKLAPWKAATESALISFVSLIMLGLAGLTLRELLQAAAAVRPALAHPNAPVERPASAPAAPAQVQDTPRILRYRRREAGYVGASAETEIAPVAPVTPMFAPAPVAPAQVQEVQKVRVQAVKRVQSPKVHRVPAGLLAAIKSGECKPAQKAIRVFAGCGQDMAIVYLAELAADGIIEPMPGKSGWWRLVKVAA